MTQDAFSETSPTRQQKMQNGMLKNNQMKYNFYKILKIPSTKLDSP